MARSRVPAIERLVSLLPEYSREELLALILCGDARFDGETVRDPRQDVRPDAEVSFRNQEFVSRGGIKLDHALGVWGVDVAGKVFLDAGSSTGGFTEALLLRGAAGVHAVDVGYNQLDYILRTDSRVIVHERTNIMDVTALEPEPEAAVADLSFRSLFGAASHILGLTSGRWAVLLLKPQFEWTNPPTEFDGTVPDARASEIVVATVERLAEESVFAHDCIESPIRGRAGNREFLLLVRSQRGSVAPREVVAAALSKGTDRYTS